MVTRWICHLSRARGDVYFMAAQDWMDPARRQERATSFGSVAPRTTGSGRLSSARRCAWALAARARPLRVVDLGAGTGIMTRVWPPGPATVTPSNPTRGCGRGWSARLAGIEALAGAAEALPLPDASVDAVIAGQAYHWFDREPGPRRDRPGRSARAASSPRSGTTGTRRWVDRGTPQDH